MNENTILAILPNIGPGELFLVMGIALLLFGAKRLPALARSAGQSMSEFRKAQREFQDEFKNLD